MSIRMALCATILVATWLASVRFKRSWSRGTEMFIGNVVWFAIGIAHVYAAHALLGGYVWLLLPLYAAAGYFGSTPLGALNFLVLQWVGVRLAPGWSPVAEDAERGRWLECERPAARDRDRVVPDAMGMAANGLVVGVPLDREARAGVPVIVTEPRLSHDGTLSPDAALWYLFDRSAADTGDDVYATVHEQAEDDRGEVSAEVCGGEQWPVRES